ncbi:selenium binding protein [Acinetobacter radioresistens]|uniref:selenium binding protein n=1 Tax=Acinetobacter radioresistens TaxID=40216 RepID=UPI002004F100|nr:selenium binding protein [Acinetobacter radioresistens]MCK4089648.1 selenium binding protein [Acinetobacter radioresistens]
MYEEYTRQSLPSKRYRELLGSALCVFNSNNSFVIENILRSDQNDEFNWHDLVDRTSGKLSEPIKATITQQSNDEIASIFSKLVEKRNRIIHSFQVTAPQNIPTPDDSDKQILATKHRDHRQEYITEDYLLVFIKENEELSSALHAFRGY